ncbi:GNAT family N-acetyltransferase [Anaeromyxobacter diazotrophicus]|uniref:N-acetyltransferase n=1 Tax=Anaeromyxobacter diazotrophicus TaxID=2590199 RepID=A0A7I9VL17_9BACT|nr:GNAT family N-acetyltransferase [Anaeromyxobacter diazotrophicus]GEJ57116.1 N-acetyltransferase [Anaeromyxobacter diazotrophicus]
MAERTTTEQPTHELAVRHAGGARGGAFLVERGGERLAELTYRRDEAGRAVIEHTEVSEVLRGQGVARRLVDAAVAWSRESGVKLVPVCTYAKKVLEHDPALRDVLG